MAKEVDDSSDEEELPIKKPSARKRAVLPESDDDSVENLIDYFSQAEDDELDEPREAKSSEVKGDGRDEAVGANDKSARGQQGTEAAAANDFNRGTFNEDLDESELDMDQLSNTYSNAALSSANQQPTASVTANVVPSTASCAVQQRAVASEVAPSRLNFDSPMQSRFHDKAGVIPSSDYLDQCLAHVRRHGGNSANEVDQIWHHILHSDLRDVVRSPLQDGTGVCSMAMILRKSVHESQQSPEQRQTLPSNFRLLVQLEECIDWTQNSEQRLASMSGGSVRGDNSGHNSGRFGQQQRNSRQRMLKLVVSDGYYPNGTSSSAAASNTPNVSILQAMETSIMNSLAHTSPPGLKLCLHGPIPIRRGLLQLSDEYVAVLGGQVPYWQEIRDTAQRKAEKKRGLGVDPTIKALCWNNNEDSDEELDEGEGESGDVTRRRQQQPPSQGMVNNDNQQQRETMNRGNTSGQVNQGSTTITPPNRPAVATSSNAESVGNAGQNRTFGNADGGNASNQYSQSSQNQAARTSNVAFPQQQNQNSANGIGTATNRSSSTNKNLQQRTLDCYPKKHRSHASIPASSHFRNAGGSTVSSNAGNKGVANPYGNRDSHSRPNHQTNVATQNPYSNRTNSLNGDAENRLNRGPPTNADQSGQHPHPYQQHPSKPHAQQPQLEPLRNGPSNGDVITIEDDEPHQAKSQLPKSAGSQAAKPPEDNPFQDFRSVAATRLPEAAAASITTRPSFCEFKSILKQIASCRVLYEKYTDVTFTVNARSIQHASTSSFNIVKAPKQKKSKKKDKEKKYHYFLADAFYGPRAEKGGMIICQVDHSIITQYFTMQPAELRAMSRQDRQKASRVVNSYSNSYLHDYSKMGQLCIKLNFPYDEFVEKTKSMNSERLFEEVTTPLLRITSREGT
ncbi:hypothetical protein THAOC_19949 [Thalassiosira oceanica]|uniref:RecQ-mediated genome instability protein 1 n=1 Tax=Thalassiosira oceanica TaxID=159749 RepID=K0S3J3_THAOC|nr:hypothetical protein THAOC_19949 [Thalassiosira oceanica]|eukprot:EJK59785.1 hypothetical protein THAOC_19949 [Thalassiosira oceanica]